MFLKHPLKAVSSANTLIYNLTSFNLGYPSHFFLFFFPYSYIPTQESLPVKHGWISLYKYNTRHVQYITNIDYFLVSYMKPIILFVARFQAIAAFSLVQVDLENHSRG